MNPGPPKTPHGHEAYEAVSALQKSIRRGDVEGAAYWAWQLEAGGTHAAVLLLQRGQQAPDRGLGRDRALLDLVDPRFGQRVQSRGGGEALGSGRHRAGRMPRNRAVAGLLQEPAAVPITRLTGYLSLAGVGAGGRSTSPFRRGPNARRHCRSSGCTSATKLSRASCCARNAGPETREERSLWIATSAAFVMRRDRPAIASAASYARADPTSCTTRSRENTSRSAWRIERSGASSTAARWRSTAVTKSA